MGAVTRHIVVPQAWHAVSHDASHVPRKGLAPAQWIRAINENSARLRILKEVVGGWIGGHTSPFPN